MAFVFKMINYYWSLTIEVGIFLEDTWKQVKRQRSAREVLYVKPWKKDMLKEIV